jgi:hypothetical protein
MGKKIKATALIAVSVAIALLMSCFVSCSAGKKLTEVGSYAKDSVRIMYREKTVLDTITVEIEKQKDENATKDSMSFVTTDNATSAAWIDKDGILHHTLNQGGRVEVKTAVKYVYRDSVVYKDKLIKVKETGQKTWYENIKDKYFTPILAALLLLLLLLSLFIIFTRFK